jgi:outer membrane protein OmpA-like peptidoglycan-associated protein
MSDSMKNSGLKGENESMRGKGLRVAVWLLALCSAVLMAHAQAKARIKGLIITRTGETIVLKTSDGDTVTVVLNNNTKVQEPKRLIGVRKKSMSVLVPGLKVSVEGTSQDATHVLAESITLDRDDLQTAEMIQAGLTPAGQKVATNQQNAATNAKNIKEAQQDIAANQQNVAANQQATAANKAAIDANAVETSKRFAALTGDETKGQVDVHFASGSTKFSPEDQAALKKLAADAVKQTGYMIQVKGFADSSGNAALNQKLSMERAQNVIAFLIQDCNVPVRHVIAQGAMGEAAPVATNETAAGRAENRRVEVKVLVNNDVPGS